MNTLLLGMLFFSLTKITLNIIETDGERKMIDDYITLSVKFYSYLTKMMDRHEKIKNLRFKIYPVIQLLETRVITYVDDVRLYELFKLYRFPALNFTYCNLFYNSNPAKRCIENEVNVVFSAQIQRAQEDGLTEHEAREERQRLVSQCHRLAKLGMLHNCLEAARDICERMDGLSLLLP